MRQDAQPNFSETPRRLGQGLPDSTSADLTALAQATQNALNQKANASTVGGLSTAVGSLQTRADSVDTALLALQGVTANVPQFVTTAMQTVAQVIANYPASAAYRGKYVRVSDLYGFIDGVMRCGLDAATNTYFWQPTTPEYGRTINVTGNMTFAPLTSPTSIALGGSIATGITRTVSLTTTNGRPGEIKEIKNGMSGLGALNLNVTGIGSALAFALGSYKKFFLDFSSGTPAWVQLV